MNGKMCINVSTKMKNKGCTQGITRDKGYKGCINGSTKMKNKGCTLGLTRDEGERI